MRYEIKGGKELYMQEQLIAAKGSYYSMIGYTAPEALFPRYRPVMERALATFEFSR